MKEITKYWKQTCIDFGRYVQQQWARHEDVDMLWLEFQEQKAAIKQNEMIRQKLEEAEEEGFDDDLEFGSKQIIINHDMFKIVEQLQSQVKALHTIVSANGIALNNVERDLYLNERFVFNEKSYEESNKENNKI